MVGEHISLYHHGNDGVPDRLVVLPEGKIGFAEMKRPGGATRKGQDRQIEYLRKLGFTVEVIDSVEGIDSFLEKLK